MTHNNTYIADITIEVMHIFFKEDGFFKSDGKKYKYASPWNANKLVNPVRNVELIPFPNTGKIFSATFFHLKVTTVELGREVPFSYFLRKL